MKPKIVITGITSFRNHGVEALVVTTIAELRRRIPGAQFLVLDRAADYDAACLPADDVRFMVDASVRSLYRGGLRKVLTKFSNHLKFLDRDYQNVRREIASASCVVASGGDVFCSEYGHRSLLSHLMPLRIARECGVPYVFHAQSIGPFTNDPDRAAFLDVARGAAAITVREQCSYKYLLEEMKLPASLVQHVADPAFLLERRTPEEGKAMIAHHRSRPERPVIALSTSQAICHWMKSDNDRHIEAWLEVVRYLLDDVNADLVLVPHVQETSVRNDDRVLATAIQRRLGHDPRVRLAGGDYGAPDFKAIIAQCDMVVAERMHAAIAGLSSGVPTLVVGYSIKGEGILTDLLGAEMTKERALISIQDFLAPGSGVAAVRKAWDGRQAMADKLAAVLPGTREKSGEAFDIVAGTLKKPAGAVQAAPISNRTTGVPAPA